MEARTTILVCGIVLWHEDPRVLVRGAHRLGALWRQCGGKRYRVGESYVSRTGDHALFLDLFGGSEAKERFELARARARRGKDTTNA